ncbi:hypothetical protein J25TS5_45860 [Paenibacillus faecis]|nr:hypothetical protein J25TS5_45860 [Paenibacillus faecis]
MRKKPADLQEFSLTGLARTIPTYPEPIPNSRPYPELPTLSRNSRPYPELPTYPEPIPTTPEPIPDLPPAIPGPPQHKKKNPSSSPRQGFFQIIYA